MRRWPSIEYFARRDSRAEAKRVREALLAHCRSCGCIVCQVRLATMNEFFDADSMSPGEEEKIVLKEFLN
jgi:glutaminase